MKNDMISADVSVMLCPVGILAAHCAFFRGAERVVIIDEVVDRLQFAKEKVPKVETLNFKEKKVRPLRSQAALCGLLIYLMANLFTLSHLH